VLDWLKAGTPRLPSRSKPHPRRRSGLALKSERLVAQAVARLCHGRSTLAIAHRLHTVAGADCIHVVNAGLVVETGTHAGLLRLKGEYAKLCESQFGFERPIASEVA
jgi:ABC-type transport system involved in cytochrome bd biosynthesis fused ATPase/permease subunit